MGLLIDMIDVGQGDSFLLTIDGASGEAHVLIDAGLPDAGAKVLKYIQSYGIRAQVERGHLILEDGIGPNRRKARFSRVGHGLRRLVVIGSDGMLSLAAIQWLRDQEIAFSMLNRDGSVLATTGPVSPSDVRLRRAQSLAHQSGLALRIARELIDQKLRRQEHIIQKYFPDSPARESIVNARSRLMNAKCSDDIRVFESRGALAYWGAWHNVAVGFPRVDMPRVPQHWLRFGTRMSPLTMSPRLAVNPPNAMLNYLYAILESEARLALAALGLDPGMGVLHNDLRSRDSLALDLLEPIRPQADAYLLDWLTQGPLKREWFFEQRDGNCRLMGPFAAKLSESALMWRRALAPFAEGIARALWASTSKRRRRESLSTPLTQTRKRKARNISATVKPELVFNVPNVCGVCGTSIATACKYCRTCATTVRRENVIRASKLGRLETHKPQAQARRSETQRRQQAARKNWKSESLPGWFNEKFYREQIQPKISKIQVRTIQIGLSVSEPYAQRIRGGACIPHPRHWQKLAALANLN
jgi:CRISPR-associated endonuclease Cas1